MDNIWIPVALRTALIPLVVLAAKDVWFHNDLWDALFVGTLGFGNGYFGVYRPTPCASYALLWDCRRRCSPGGGGDPSVLDANYPPN